MAPLPPIWVVSLERAPERREFVVRSFAEADLPYELVDAVDGAMLSPADGRSYSHTRALFEVGRGLTQGELGCALSHLRLLERMVDEGVPEAVIMEDDVAPTATLGHLLALRDRIPSDRDVVTFCSLSSASSPSPLEHVHIDDEYRVCTYQRMLFGAQCYLINQQAARRVLDAAYPIRMPYDELLFRRRPLHLRVYGIEPRPVSLEPFTSELVARAAPPVVPTLGERLVSLPVAVAGRVQRRMRRLAGRVETPPRTR